jgi:hypothetical protein
VAFCRELLSQKLPSNDIQLVSDYFNQVAVDVMPEQLRAVSEAITYYKDLSNKRKDIIKDLNNTIEELKKELSKKKPLL